MYPRARTGNLFVEFLTTIAVCDVSDAREDRRRARRRPHQEISRARSQRPFQTDPIPTGFLVIDGQLINSPYQVEWDGKALHINGTVLEHPSGYRMAQRICDVLKQADIEIICSGTAHSIPISSDEGDAFLRWVAGPEKSESDLGSVLIALKNDFDTKLLRSQLLSLFASSDSIARVQESLSIIDNIYRANVAANQAVTRLQKLSYPLTMLGMVLTVIAFRHLLSHRPAQTASWWMCLVCTVLTFRWLTFNSLMMG